MLKIEKLHCEYLNNPLGIDKLNPGLSWVLSSFQRGVIQEAYRILVSSTLQKLSSNEGDLWDSGKMESSNQNHILYTGKPLKTGIQCFWKVMVWSNDANKQSDWSLTCS